MLVIYVHFIYAFINSILLFMDCAWQFFSRRSFGHDRRKCTKVCTDAYETHNYDHVGAPNNVENVNLNLIGSSDGLLQSDSQHGCNKELMDSNWFQIIPPGQVMYSLLLFIFV